MVHNWYMYIGYYGQRECIHSLSFIMKKRFLNIDGQQFQHYQQIEKPSLTRNY